MHKLRLEGWWIVDISIAARLFVFEAHIHHAANGIIAIAGAAYNGDGERAEAAALGRLARPILLLDDDASARPCTRPDGVLIA